MTCLPLPKKSNGYLAAVSGGPDSMALLDIYRKQIAVVCHVNYHKRLDSNVDQQIVSDYCKKHHLKLEILDVTDSIYQQYPISNFQNQARRIRYDFFAKIANKCKLDTVLVAHHQDDWIETAFLQNQRASLSLYYGIKQISNYQNLIVFRPLLEVTKQDLINYCLQNKIAYAVDQTNDLDTYQRNRNRKIISNWSNDQRNEFVALINAYNAKNQQTSKQLQPLLEDWINQKYPVDWLLSKPSQLQNQLIYYFFKNAGLEQINRFQIQNLLNFLKARHWNKHVRIANNIFVFVKNGLLTITTTNF